MAAGVQILVDDDGNITFEAVDLPPTAACEASVKQMLQELAAKGFPLQVIADGPKPSEVSSAAAPLPAAVAKALGL